MPFGIDGIGDEVLNFFILVFVSFIIFFAWKSTSVRTERLRPLLGSRILLDPHRRLQLIANTTTNVINSHPITANSSRSESRESNLTEEIGFDEVSSIEELTQTILTEATESLNPIPASLEELEQEAIIHVMDHNNIEPSTSSSSTDGGLRQRNVHSALVNSEAQTVELVTKDSLNVPPAAAEPKEIDLSQQIRIKLKYLNDELKLVQGNLEEGKLIKILVFKLKVRSNRI
jgi:transmembrane and ubiquitin-like domain-containing protein